jgi:hypothetical protein
MMGALTLAACGVVMGPAVAQVASDDATPTHSCTAAIVAAEDGSWDSGALVYDGQVVDERWADRMPSYGWRPGYKGVECSLAVQGEAPSLAPTVTITATKPAVTVTATKTKTLMRVVKRTVASRSVVTKRPPVGYVLTSDGRLVKVWAECFKLRESEVRPGNPDPGYAWKFCDSDGDEWKDQPR